MSPENPGDTPASAAPDPPVASNGVDSHPVESHIWSPAPNGDSPDIAQNGEPPSNGVILNGTPLEMGEAPPQVSDHPSEHPSEHASENPSDQDPGQPRSTLSEWVITILLLLFLTTTLVQAFVIPTGSMEDTLLIGDHLLVDKLAYAPPGPISKYILPYTDVKRGDIIVFRYPTDIEQTFVKRCIGVPGDHIKLVDKVVYLDGKPLVEPYKYNKTDYIDSYRDDFPSEPNVTLEPGAIKMLQQDEVNGEIVVPPGMYFAMGDNRDSSWDSRYWGFVPRQNIIGKPLIIYWSYDRPSDQLNTNSITLPQILDLAEHFFSKTRWRRTFQLIHGYPIRSVSDPVR